MNRITARAFGVAHADRASKLANQAAEHENSVTASWMRDQARCDAAVAVAFFECAQVLTDEPRGL